VRFDTWSTPLAAAEEGNEDEVATSFARSLRRGSDRLAPLMCTLRELSDDGKDRLRLGAMHSILENRVAGDLGVPR